jgi:hypothetical protein
MKVSFSLSPGGLLLPYHLGVLDSLKYNKFLDETTHIAGSSAGAIATASHGCGLPSVKVLENTIDISDRCKDLGGARGRLLPMLREEMAKNIGDAEFEYLQNREGAVGIAYKEIFPRNRPYLQTEFQDKYDLINSVCHSSMFPFFATNWPCALDTSSGGIPRLVVDGFFTVPRERFGCPDFSHANIEVERTVSICVFPHESIGLDASSPHDVISPQVEEEGGGGGQLQRLLRLATESSSREELTALYESGFKDGERWCRAESDKEKKAHRKELALSGANGALRDLN